MRCALVQISLVYPGSMQPQSTWVYYISPPTSAGRTLTLRPSKLEFEQYTTEFLSRKLTAASFTWHLGLAFYQQFIQKFQSILSFLNELFQSVNVHSPLWVLFGLQPKYHLKVGNRIYFLITQERQKTTKMVINF